MPKGDFYEITVELGKKLDALRLDMATKDRMLEEAEWMLEKALWLIYQTPYLQTLKGAGDVVMDIEDTVNKLKDLHERP